MRRGDLFAEAPQVEQIDGLRAQRSLPSFDGAPGQGRQGRASEISDERCALARRGSRWVDSQVTVWASANGSSFDRSYGLAGDVWAAFDLHLSLAPRFRLGRGFQLRAWWGLNVELTPSESTTPRELRASAP